MYTYLPYDFIQGDLRIFTMNLRVDQQMFELSYFRISQTAYAFFL
jgi:hypothetical protein